ncbi:MAG: hypothetical protein K2M96_01715 [Prevotella sp.]|nr:hypothetical protein [Prevotella sp.]
MNVNFRRLWQYSFAVAMLMFVIGIAIDFTDVTTYTRRMQGYMAEGDYAKALQVGERSDKTDRRLLLLRMEALDHEHLLGERLFIYPVIGRGGQLVHKGGDYELCAYLIDKNLTRFVAVLPKYYALDEQLPRHYREALVLYMHQHSNPAVVYHDNVMETDYKDMQQQERLYPDPKARQMVLSQNYGGTYWYYYDYLNK